MKRFTFDQSFTENKDMLIPKTANFRPIKDANGRDLSGDELMTYFAKTIEAFETKFKRPIPIPDQKFVAWIKQYKNKLDSGMKSEDIMNQTLVKNI